MVSGRSSVGWRIRCCVGPNRSSHATQTTERHPTTLNKNDVVMMAFSRLLFSYTAFSFLAFFSLVLRRPLRVLVSFFSFFRFCSFPEIFLVLGIFGGVGFFSPFPFLALSGSRRGVSVFPAIFRVSWFSFRVFVSVV